MGDFYLFKNSINKLVLAVSGAIKLWKMLNLISVTKFTDLIQKNGKVFCYQ